MEAKLYFCAAGIGGTPAWTEISNAKDVTLTVEKGQADVSTRANNGWKATAGTLKDATIDWDMVWNTSDPGFAAIKTAFMDNTVIGMAVMSGPMTEAASEGLQADCMILSFTRSEPLQEAITVKVQAKPTLSATAPSWINGTAPVEGGGT
jgi:hypothetical protein